MANCILLLNTNDSVLLNDGSNVLLNDDTCTEFNPGKKFRVKKAPVYRQMQVLQTVTIPIHLRSRLFSHTMHTLPVYSKLYKKQKTGITIQSGLKVILGEVIKIKARLRANIKTDLPLQSSLKLRLFEKTGVRGIKDYSKIDKLLILLGLVE